MFRNIAIALVAASVLAAPAMAQNSNTLSGGSSSSQSKPSTESPEKADKTPEKSAETADSAEKSATKHHKVARHHRHHGAKAAKLGKSRTSGMALYGKHRGLRTMNEARYEGRHAGHGRTMGRHAYGRASKHMRMHTPSKPMHSPSVD
jgi:hypothetical protein